MTFRRLFFGFSLLFSLLVFGQTTSRIISGDSSEGFFSLQNLLKNAGWEKYSNYWTSSGGSYSRTTTAANVGRGAGSGSWDPSGGNQVLTSDAITIPPGMYNSIGQGSCKVKCGSVGSCTEKFGVWNGSTYLATSTAVSTEGLYVRIASRPFVIPSSGTMALRFAAVSANEPNIFIDDCYLGEVADKPILVGTLKYAPATNCIWTRNASTYSDFAPDTDCGTPTVTDLVTAPATKVPHALVANALPGIYQVIASFDMGEASVSESGSCRLVDETNAGSAEQGYRVDGGANEIYPTTLVGSFPVLDRTGGTSKTFKIQCLSAAGTVRLYGIPNGSGGGTVTFTIYRSPL